MWRVKATVQLKEGVLDVQGRALEAALKHLGYEEVEDVKIGKQVEFVTKEKPPTEKLKEMGDKLLANPTIETINFSVSEVKS